MSRKEILKKVTGTKHLKSKFNQDSDIILRDFLALERTTLANERTLFSYLRSGVYLVVAGFAFLKLKNYVDLDWLSYILFALSLFMFIFGFVRFLIVKRKLEVYYNNMEQKDASKKESKKDKTQESEM